MSDSIHALIDVYIPENGKLRALEMYAMASEIEDSSLDNWEMLADISHSLQVQEARKAIFVGVTGPILAFGIMLLIREVLIPYELSEISGFLAIMAVFAAWFGLYKASERAIERHSMRAFSRRNASRRERSVVDGERASKGARRR